MPEDNHQKLLSVVARVFDVGPVGLTDETSQDDIDRWDSFGMINLVNELELSFGVSFDILEIIEFRTVGIIKDSLAEKGISFP
ncbi:MAG: acyl carrier protein [Rhodospirillales bacterium]